MNYRYNKRLQKKVSEVGFGAWQLGGTGSSFTMSDEEGIRLVQEAINKGVNFFDTAPNYANGRSELILGKAIQGHREKVIINTKVGHGPNEAWEFDKEGIRRSVLRSIDKLQTTYLDSVILHNPEQYILKGNNEQFDELTLLKNEGKVKLVGVSIDSLEELEIALHNTQIDVIEIMFNMIHQEPKELFEKAREMGILLIIKVPLDSGWLTGKYNSDSTFKDIRARWNQSVKEERAQIVSDLKAIVGEENLVQKALAYILHYDAVTTVIPGTKSIKQLDSNILASSKRLSADEINQIETYYNLHLKDKVIPW